MNRLDDTSLAEFLARFYSFNDGVVRKITVDFTGTPRTCEVAIEAQDAESASGWSAVCLRIDGLSTFRLEMGRTSFEVLSSGIQVGWRDGQVFLFLDAYPEDEGLPDLSKNCGYIAGQELRWTAVRR